MEEAELENSQENPEVSDAENNSEQNNQVNGKPAGYDPVDLSDLPPEKQQAINDRISYLYRQVKDNGRTLSEYRTIAQQQSQQIEELMSGVGNVVDHLHKTSSAQQEAQIMERMQAAFEAGDTKAYVAEQANLIRLHSKQQTQTKKTSQPQKQQQNNSLENNAASSGDMSPEDARYVDAWQSETDERGVPLRPWAENRMASKGKADPDFLKAYAIASNVAEDNPGLSVKEILAEVDRQMGTRKPNGSQTVMGGSLTGHGKQKKIQLTPKQQEIAVKTKFGGPKAKSDAEHLEAYRKQIEITQSSRKGR